MSYRALVKWFLDAPAAWQATKKGPAIAGPSSLGLRAARYFFPPALATLESRLFCRAAAFG